MTAPWMARVARWSIAHRWLVMTGWVVLAVAGGPGGVQVGQPPVVCLRSSRPARVRDEHGDCPDVRIRRQRAAAGSGGPASPGGDRSVAGDQGAAGTGVRESRGSAAGRRTASWVSTGDRAFVSADGRTTFQLIYPAASFTSSNPYATALPRLDRALASQRVHGAPVLITGATILSSGGQGGGNSVLVETLLAGLGALVVLAVVFGSFIAITPLIIAAVAIPTAFAFTLTYLTTMSTLVQNIVALVGLGVAIDYALLIVTRWREERGYGQSNRAAVLRASATAGSSALCSGITVAVSLAALALTTVPFLRSIGMAGILIPLTSIGVSATLLPVILDGIGPRLEWPRCRPARTASPLWTKIARGVVAHPGWSATARSRPCCSTCSPWPPHSAS
jgi:putative drug exporter of the RND superfamily